MDYTDMSMIFQLIMIVCIYVDDVFDIHKYLMKKHKLMFRWIKQVFITFLSFSESLASMTSVCNFTT